MGERTERFLMWAFIVLFVLHTAGRIAFWCARG
jgi:hypothetical protein